MVSAVVKEESSEARNVTAAAISSGVPGRLRGIGVNVGPVTDTFVRPLEAGTSPGIRVTKVSPSERVLA